MRHMIAATLVLGATAANVYADIIADSVADFGGVQGANGWHYGYVEPSTSSAVQLMPQFGMHAGSPALSEEPAWFISYSGDPIEFPTPYTNITAAGGHPNGGTNAIAVEHWTVRRWVAPFAGTFDFSGLLGDYAADFGFGGDGVLAEAQVDGVAVWSFSTSGTTAEFPYSFEASLAAGQAIDFVVKPKLNENTDYYIWTVQVVPGPSALLVVAFGACGLAVRRRRD